MLKLLLRQGYFQVYMQPSCFDVAPFRGDRKSRKGERDAKNNSRRNWDRKRLDRRDIYNWMHNHFRNLISR
jgi:hypothetical protein